MALNREIRRLINVMAEEVINLYGIQIPIINIEEVVQKMGGSVVDNSSIGEFSDGKIRKTGEDSFTIEVSPFQTEERKNFTIAHELGHLFLHMGFQTNEQKWQKQDNVSYYRNGNSELEYQSNEFAAAFLMPRVKYKEIMEQNTEGDFVNTAEVAKYFRVSIDAAANRGKWLGYLKW